MWSGAETDNMKPLLLVKIFFIKYYFNQKLKLLKFIINFHKFIKLNEKYFSSFFLKNLCNNTGENNICSYTTHNIYFNGKNLGYNNWKVMVL